MIADLSTAPLRRGFSFTEMDTLYNQALAWREAFEVQSDSSKDSPQFNLQIALIVEEYREVIEAFVEYDETDQATKEHLLKELADLVFVCFQAAANMGWNLDKAMKSVFDSNMTKLVNGSPIRNETGKVMKGPFYSPPDLTSLIAEGEESPA